MFSVHMLDKGMIHYPGGTEKDAIKFHHDLNEVQCKTYFFISGIFH